RPCTAGGGPLPRRLRGSLAPGDDVRAVLHTDRLEHKPDRHLRILRSLVASSAGRETMGLLPAAPEFVSGGISALHALTAVVSFTWPSLGSTSAARSRMRFCSRTRAS